MKHIIKNVLDDMNGKQVNLDSDAARIMLSNLISAALKDNGTYKNYTEYELEEQKAKESWICTICGGNTFEVDYDYIGTGTNHLGCELKMEMSSSNDAEFDDVDYYTGPEPDYDYSVVDNLGYDTKDKKQKMIGKISKKEWQKLNSWHEEER